MSKRKRDPAFAASEKMSLIELVERHFDVVENKKTDVITTKMKNEEWQKIATEFNSISCIHPREWGVLKNCWENLKKRAKQTQTSRNQHFMGTGGGPPKKTVEDPATERVLDLIQTRVTGFTNTFDSDGTLVLASGSINVHGEGTSQLITEIIVPSQQEECSNDAQWPQPEPEGEGHSNEREIDWSNYTPGMLRGPRNPALARTPSPVNPPMANIEETGPQLPAADPQLPARNNPLRVQTHTEASSSQNFRRRRPILRREREQQSLTSERINTLLRCNTHAEEEHVQQMKILLLQEEREKEILEQEKLKTLQEKIKLEILEIELKKLKE